MGINGRDVDKATAKTGVKAMVVVVMEVMVVFLALGLERGLM